jgi:hypothetical protein
MSATQDAAEIIEEILETIEEDPVASLVGDAIRAAWSGHRFDDELLRARLDGLLHGEEPA